MSDKKSRSGWLQSLFSSKETEEKQEKPLNNKTKWMMIAVVLGISFMFLSDWQGKKEIETVLPGEASEAASEQTQPPPEDFEAAYEEDLKEALEQIAGVSNVSVVVTVEASEKKVLEKNTAVKAQETKEEDTKGGERTVRDQTQDEELVTVKKGDGEEPVVLEVKKPDIRGVLVVAEGAENIQVKKWIIESVTRALNVPSHRVAVMPRKPKEDV